MRPEVGGAEAQGDASPVVGAAAFDAGAKPSEARAGSSGVGLAIDLPKAIGSHEFSVELVAGSASDIGSTMGEFVGPDVLLEILFRVQDGASLEHDNAQSTFGQHLGGCSPSRARADDTDVVWL